MSAGIESVSCGSRGASPNQSSCCGAEVSGRVVWRREGDGSSKTQRETDMYTIIGLVLAVAAVMMGVMNGS